MLEAIILLIFGLVLVFLEFFAPGAILGTLGGVALLASTIVFAFASDSGLYSFLYFLFVIGSVVLLVRFALHKIRTNRSGIYSEENQEGYQASYFDATFIGQKGKVYSDLKPGGYILINDVQVPAISESGYLVRGTEVEVIGGEGESLIVKKI